MNRRRCIEPAVYNVKRLKELPIPLISPLRENANWREDTPPNSQYSSDNVCDLTTTYFIVEMNKQKL